MTESIVTMPKSRYSETVIRKTLYWLSAYSEWRLEEVGDNWMIMIVERIPDEGVRQFHRLLNDQLLRETLDKETQHLRRAIAKRVLAGLGGE